MGRVKVALAGLTTRTSAVVLTLLEMAAIGQLTTKKTLPTIVATRQTGRTMTTSATTMAGSGRVWAKVELVAAKQKASTHKKVISFVFICPLNTPIPGPLSRQIRGLFRGTGRRLVDS